MEENYLTDQQIDKLLVDIIDSWCRILKCNERWMNAHNYTDTHSKIIMVLKEYPQGCTQTLISNKSGVSKQQVSAVLKEFEKNGVITRKKSLQDERFNDIVFTEHGLNICKQVSAEFKQLFQKIASECALEDRKEILKSISILVRAYEKALKESGY